MQILPFVGLSESGGPFPNLFLGQFRGLKVRLSCVPHQSCQTSKRLPLPFSLLNVELSLKRGALFKVEFVGKRVVKCTSDARLVLVECLLKPGRRAGDCGRTVDDDGRLEQRF